MDLVGFFRELLRHKVLVAAMVTISLLAAILSAYKLPSFEKRSISIGAATGQILVDSDPSTLVAGAGTDQIAALGSRARVYAQYLSSRDAVTRISTSTGIPAHLITARGPFSQGTGISNYEQQPAESRAKDLTDEGKGYRLVFEAQEDVPIITVYATGPSADSALKMTSASFKTLEHYVDALKKHDSDGGAPIQPVKPVTGTATTADNIVVRELGAPEGGTVGSGSGKIMMIMAFIAALGIQCLLVAGIFRLRAQRRFEREVDELTDGAAASLIDPLDDPDHGPERRPDRRPTRSERDRHEHDDLDDESRPRRASTQYVRP